MTSGCGGVDQGCTKHLTGGGLIPIAATTLTERDIPFTFADRCDSCGVQAFIRAVFVSGELTFCGHHGRELLLPLQREAILVEDGTDLINPKQGPSADDD